MTIEQKAKRYDEALKWMRSLYPTMTGIDKEDAEQYFPELRESEDERIRKELIYHIQNCDDTIDEETEKRMVAWLEKQGEQKPTDAEMKELLRTEYEKGRADAIAEIQVAWSEEDEKMLNLIIAIFEVNHQYGYFKANELNDSNMKTVYTEEIVDWLKSLEIRITNKQ